VTFTGAEGLAVTWHVLDTGPGPRGTIVCVHGNPSWSYLWKDLLTTLSPQWRVVAVDQSSMGYSERTGPRRLADRVDELVAFCRQEAPGPIVLAAHDWGGAIATGAAGSLDVAALILSNTAVAKPEGVRVPPLIGAARSAVDLTCRRSPAFVRGAAAMTGRAHREALLAPYATAARRTAVAEFVADIPVRETDPSFAALARSAAVLDSLECPILLLWGGRDPVFHDRFLRDLRERAPHADVQRFAGAGHFVALDEPVGRLLSDWLDTSLEDRHRAAPARVTSSETEFRSVLADLRDRALDASTAYEGPDGSISWAALEDRSNVAAGVLAASGVVRGTRVSLLVPPSSELLVAVAAVWKLGAVLVAADASAGVAQLRRLVRAAAPRFVIGTPATLAVARTSRFAPGAGAAAFAKVPGAADLRAGVAGGRLPTHEPSPADLAAIVHTSGATGPAKPVRYTHGALAAQRDVLGGLWHVDPGDAFTTSFGPFMLLAPSLGMGCVRPDFDPDKPAELTFDALAGATERAKVTTAWLSPASARTIVATAAGRTLPIRLVLLAGAPIPATLAEAVGAITGAEVRAPYGMTECLPVTDGVDPTASGPLGGTATGRALPGCAVAVVPIDDPEGAELGDAQMGELLVSAPWLFDGYDARWADDHATRILRGGQRFHRTGDVGYVVDGVVFQLGRARHVLRTPQGTLASVAIEERVAAQLGRPAAAVGVGPAGTAVVVVVIDADHRLQLAPSDLSKAARDAAGVRVAAVLTGRLPVDRRHQSKVGRTELAAAVSVFLAGR